MATKSEIVLPNGDKITGNWSTEETLSNVLKILEKKYGKTGTGGTEKKEEEANKKRNRVVAKAQDIWTKRVKKSQETIKKLDEATKRQLEKYPKLTNAMELAADSTKLAGQGIKKLGGKAKDLHDDLEGLGGSAQNTSNTFMSLVGGAGALGAAFGFVAGIIDQYADFQIAAIQTGFGFSSELTNTRLEVGKLGMNMAQYGRILSENGEAIRALGKDGLESSYAFIELVNKTKTAAYEFGMFGMTTEEVSGQLAQQLKLLTLQGITGKKAADAANAGFMELSKQTFALSQMTGRERREIMRNNLATRESSEQLVHYLAELGPNAQASYQGMLNGLTGVFGDAGGDELSSIIDNTLLTISRGFESRTADQLATMQMIPGMKDTIEKYAREFNANANDTVKTGEISLRFNRELAELMASQQDNTVKMLGVLSSAGDASATPLANLVSGVQNATNFLNMSLDDQLKVWNSSGIEDANTTNLLLIRDRIDTLQNTFMGALLKGMGLDKLEDLANEGTFNGLMTGIDTFGDSLANFREGVVAVADFFGVDSPTGLIAIMTAGAVALFAANSLFTMAMVAGANKVWGRAAAISAVGDAAGGPGGGPGGGKASNLLKWVGLLGAINVASELASAPSDPKEFAKWQDENRKGMESTLFAIPGMTPLYDGYSSMFEYFHGYRPQQPGEDPAAAAARKKAASMPIASPKFDPSVSSDGHYVPSALTGIVQGATHGANGNVNVGMDASNAWRFSNSDNAVLRQMAAALEEANRINKRLLDAAENQ